MVPAIAAHEQVASMAIQQEALALYNAVVQTTYVVSKNILLCNLNVWLDCRVQSHVASFRVIRQPLWIREVRGIPHVPDVSDSLHGHNLWYSLLAVVSSSSTAQKAREPGPTGMEAAD